MKYEMYPDELKHYGVLGMKWGVRRANKKGGNYRYQSASTKYFSDKEQAAKRKYQRSVNKYNKKAAKLQNKVESTNRRATMYSDKRRISEQLDTKIQRGASEVSTLMSVLAPKAVTSALVSNATNKNKTSRNFDAVLAAFSPVPISDLNHVTYVNQEYRKRK